LHFRKIEHKPSEYSFGAYADTVRYLKAHFKAFPFAAGDKFTAADTQLASSLGFTIHQLEAVPKEPEFLAYLARVAERPAHLRAQKLDQELMQTASARQSS
jgi:glutathione S-transferase